MKKIISLILVSFFTFGVFSVPFSVNAATKAKAKVTVQKKTVKKTMKKKVVRRVIRRIPESKPPVELRTYTFPENKTYGFTFPGNFGISVDAKKPYQLQAIDAFTKKSMIINHRAGPSDGTLASAVQKYIDVTYKTAKKKFLATTYTKHTEGAQEFMIEGKKELHSVFFVGNILIDASTKNTDTTFLKQYKSIVQSVGVIK